MQKWILLGAAFLTSLTMSAAESESAAAKATLSRVDLDGNYLFYSDVSWVVPSVKKAIVPLLNGTLQSEAISDQLVQAIIKVSGVDAIRSSAISCRTAEPGVYIYKNFAYMGKPRPEGLISDLFGARNAPFEMLKSLPQDTVIAVEFTFDADVLRQAVRQVMDAVALPTFTAARQHVSRQFKQETGITFSELSRSIKGRVSLLICGTPTQPNFYLSIPDKDGVITRLLASNGLAADPKTGRAPLPLPLPLPNLKPCLIFAPGSIAVVGNPELLDRIAAAKATGGLLADASFSRYAKDMPDAGFMGIVTNITPELVNQVLLLLPPEASMLRMSNLKIQAFAVNTLVDDGIYEVAKANFSVQDIAGLYFDMMSRAMQALEQARQMQGNTEQLSDTKQLALAMMMYSADHKEALPESLGQLKEYLPDNLEINPSTIYLGKGLKLSELKQPAHTPVLLVCDHETVMVCYADGNVARVTPPQDAAMPQALLEDLLRKNPIEPAVAERLKANLTATM